MRKDAKGSFWKIKNNNLYNNSEDTYNNFDVKYCTESSGKLRPLKKRIWFLGIPTRKEKSASKCKSFSFTSKNTTSG